MIARIYFVVWSLVLIAALSFSARPWGPADTRRVDELAVLADSPQLAAVRRAAEIGAGMLPYAPGQQRTAIGVRPPLKIGWSYHEVSVLRLPFWAATDLGFVAYLELPEGIQVAPLDAAAMAAIEQRIGHSIADDQGFALYRHSWGWLVVLGLLASPLMKRRGARLARRR